MVVSIPGKPHGNEQDTLRWAADTAAMHYSQVGVKALSFARLRVHHNCSVDAMLSHMVLVVYQRIAWACRHVWLVCEQQREHAVSAHIYKAPSPSEWLGVTVSSPAFHPSKLVK